MVLWPLSRTEWGKGASRQEISGAFGDVGILFPLALSLILVNGLNPTSVFLSVGLVYIAAGLFFRIPMPVQPLKAVASIAIGGALSAELVGAAGLLTGITLLLLSVTGAITLLGRLFSTPVIKGIQLTLGLILMKSGLDLTMRPQVVADSPVAVIPVGTLEIPAGALLGLISITILLLLLRKPLLPASLALLAGGLPLGLLIGAHPNIAWTDLGPVMPTVALPQLSALGTAFFLLVLPQLPLSVGNSIFSTADVAREYYGNQAARVTPRALCLSIGLANLGAGLIGGMPVCHGAGGLTAHYRLGARTPLASIVIGATCLVLALVFGKVVAPLLSVMPFAVLGALLLYVGWRHMGLVVKVRQYSDALIILPVAAVSLLANNLAVGVALGVIIDWGLRAAFRRFGNRAWPTVANDG